VDARRAAGEKKRPLLTFSMTEESDDDELKRSKNKPTHPGRPRGEHCGGAASKKKQEAQVAAPATGSGLWPLPRQIRPNYVENAAAESRELPTTQNSRRNLATIRCLF
jgi:hypothetical protein